MEPPISGCAFFLLMEVLPHLFPRTAQLTTRVQSSCVACTDAHVLHALFLFYSEEISVALVETGFPKAPHLYPEIRIHFQPEELLVHSVEWRKILFLSLQLNLQAGFPLHQRQLSYLSARNLSWKCIGNKTNNHWFLILTSCHPFPLHWHKFWAGWRNWSGLSVISQYFTEWPDGILLARRWLPWGFCSFGCNSSPTFNKYKGS